MSELDSSEPSEEVTEDERLIDEVFDRAVDALERGEEPELADLLAGREALRARAEDAVRLARDISLNVPRPQQSLPRVAGFEIERELGSGSMGAVFLARQLSLGGRRVALKVLPPSLGLSGRAKTRFLAEARALAKLSHPGIVGVYDVVDAEGIVAYAMEWVEGSSLSRVLQAWREFREADELEVLAEVLGTRRRELSAANAVTWIVQTFAALARALSVVHAAGLLHRDIKPANVLVRRDGRLLLADFGLVRDSESSLHTRAGQYVGTLAYSAPEQLRGDQARVGERSDVYSVGVSLYEALTLSLPYVGRSSAELLASAERGAFARPRRRGVLLPRDLETILGKAIDPDPTRRYGAAVDVAEDLERLLAFQPIRARPAGPWTRAARFTRRNRATVIGTTVATVLVAALAFQGSRWALARTLADTHARAAWKEAQVALLDPRITDVLFSRKYQPSELADKTKNSLAPLVERAPVALLEYERALQFEPGLELESTIDVERQTVIVALAVGQGEPVPTTSPRFAEACPLTLRYARERLLPGLHLVERAALSAASPIDRRHLGLLAFLLADVDVAMEAWAEIALSYPGDPLADAMAGEYYRVSEQPEKAYPLLLSAFRHFDEVGFLCIQLADVASRLERVEMATELVGIAKSLRRPDPRDTLLRLEADLHAVQGEDRRAREEYRRFVEHRWAPTAYVHFAQYMELQGEPSSALRLLTTLNANHPDIPPYQRELVLATEAWWQRLDEPSWLSLRRCLDDPELPMGPLPEFLTRFRKLPAALVAEAMATKERIRSPFSRAIQAADAEAPRRLGPSIRALAESEELQLVDLGRWRALPTWVRTAHAMVLCTPLADALGPLLRNAEAAWLTRRSAPR